MKKYIFVFGFLFFIGCIKGPSGNVETNNLDPNNVVVVEGCEYFVVRAYASYTYIHKGNCKNPIHYENQTKK